MFWCLSGDLSQSMKQQFLTLLHSGASSLPVVIQPARVSLSKPADSGVFVFVSHPQVETFIVTGSEYFCLFPSVFPLVFFVHQKLNKGDYEGREWKGKKEEGEGKCNLYLAIVSE